MNYTAATGVVTRTGVERLWSGKESTLYRSVHYVMICHSAWPTRCTAHPGQIELLLRSNAGACTLHSVTVAVLCHRERQQRNSG